MFKLFSILLLVSVVVCGCNGFQISEKAGCEIKLNEKILTRLPLLLNPNRDDDDETFILPVDDDGTLEFKSKQSMELNCVDGYITIANQTTEETVATATCSPGNKFKVLKKSVPFGDIACTKYPQHIARYSGKTCSKKFREIEIGFPLESEFLTQITACFDDKEQKTLYSIYKLSYAINGYQVGFPRPDFAEGDFFHLGKQHLNALYGRDKQKSVINGLLGLPDDDNTYIQNSNDYYLARGHLAGKADFVYGSQQRLTFYYVNVAPQWQTFNGGNWNTLEKNVRNLAFDRGLDLIIYTGIYGVASLPHAKTGKQVPLYLYVDENGNEGVPIPELFWKVVYDPNTELGVALVGMNNPYEKENLEKGAICKDICDQVTWLTWNKDSIKSGYSYCCNVKDFRKTITYLPSFKVGGLLK